MPRVVVDESTSVSEPGSGAALQIGPRVWIVGCPGIDSPFMTCRVASVAQAEAQFVALKSRSGLTHLQSAELRLIASHVVAMFRDNRADAVDLVMPADSRLHGVNRQQVFPGPKVENMTIDLDAERDDEDDVGDEDDVDEDDVDEVQTMAAGHIYIDGKAIAEVDDVKMTQSAPMRAVRVMQYGPLQPIGPTTLTMTKRTRIVDVVARCVPHGAQPKLYLIAVEETDTIGDEERKFVVINCGGKVEFPAAQTTPCAYIGTAAAVGLDCVGDTNTTAGETPRPKFVFEIFEP